MILSLFLTATLAWAAPTKLTLEEAIDRAVRGATLVLKNENAKETAGADLLQAYGNFMPNLVATASFGPISGKSLQVFNGITQLDTAYSSGDYRISSTLNLFRGFSDAGSLAAAHHRNAFADLTLERARQQIALDVAQSYLQVVLDNQLVEISAKNLQVSRDRLKLFRAKEEVGSLSPADTYRQEAQAASDESSLVMAKNRASVDLLWLLQKIRANPREEYFLSPPSIRAPDTNTIVRKESELIEQAMDNRRDLKAREEAQAAAESNITVATSGFYPTLDLEGAFGGTGRHYSRALVNGESRLPPSQESLFSQLGNQNTTSLQLLLRWDLFSRFITTRNITAAKMDARNAALDREDFSNQVVIEVKQALLDLQASFDQLKAANAGLVASQKAFDLLQGRYRVGASSFLDLTTAQAVLVQAEATKAQALINFNLRERALRLALGTAVP